MKKALKKMQAIMEPTSESQLNFISGVLVVLLTASIIALLIIGFRGL